MRRFGESREERETRENLERSERDKQDAEDRAEEAEARAAIARRRAETELRGAHERLYEAQAMYEQLHGLAEAVAENPNPEAINNLKQWLSEN